MNFLFKFDLTFTAGSPSNPPRPKHTGQFSGDVQGSSNPLEKSKNWLRLLSPSPVDLNSFNPEDPANNWDEMDDMDSFALNIPKPSGNSVVGTAVRFAVHPDSPSLNPGDVLTLDYALCFGNPNPVNQPQASPFQQEGKEFVRTLFMGVSEQRNRPLPGPAFSSWYFPIAVVRTFPKKPRRSHHYQFALSARVHRGTDALEFGKDPEMDVTT